MVESEFLLHLLVRLLAHSTRFDGAGEALRGLLARSYANTAVVALAAKMARTVWALLRHKQNYMAVAGTAPA